MKITPVILSGGSGTRLWPLSQSTRPKQYQSLLTKNTMLQETLIRLNGLNGLGTPIIICNKEHRFLVSEQLNEINIHKYSLILEPVARNTAPAISAAAHYVKKNMGDGVLLILSADHDIDDADSFQKSINIAKQEVKKDKIVIFGVPPLSPYTGYGYIKVKSSSLNSEKLTVENFIEKPDLKKAKNFLSMGNYLWNCGIFMSRAGVIIEELNTHYKEIAEATKISIEKSIVDFDFIRLDEESFKLNPSISIDYALIEQSKKIVAVRLACKWSDVGSWDSLYQVLKKDNHGNAISGDVNTFNTKNSYISADNRLIIANDVKDIILVDTPDYVLLSSMKKASEVDKIAKKIDRGIKENFTTKEIVYRPWGWYQTITCGDSYKVKIIHIKPKSKLSLQKHVYRTENWVIIKGIATVTKGNDIFELRPGESTYISMNQIHSLENKRNELLKLVEVQKGDYLGEDDIERFEDLYGRDKYL
jgi:mannose-1-phosphate guanylyltransferase/mannose-6-phosphate isomerase